MLHCFGERKKNHPRSEKEAEDAFAAKLNGKAFQFGGDASTGLGYCTVVLQEKGIEDNAKS